MNIIPKNTNILHKQSLKLSDDVVRQLEPKPTPLAYTFDAIPRDFKDLNQWVLWKYILKDGKWTKIPYQVTNRNADSTKSATWTTFDNAVKAYGTGKFSGIGFCIGDSGLTCVDIDHEDEWKKGKLDKLLDGLNNKYYMETSPSGNGYHLWIKATKPNGMGCKSKSFHDNFVEIYNSKRFMTMTGVVINGHTSIQEAQTELETVFAPLMPKPKPPQIPTQQQTPLNLDDKAIVDLIISSAARGTSGAITFCKLHNNGNPEGGDYSGNEFSCMSTLAFYTGSNPAQMDRIHRSGAMMRDQWDEARGAVTYGQYTINNAIAKTSKHYDSKHNDCDVTFLSDVDFDDVSDTDNVISNIEPDADPFGLASVDINKPHGIAGKICEAMLSMAHRPLVGSYPSTAFHILNQFNGKRQGIGGLKINLITLTIAVTGAGKELNAKVNAQISESFKRLKPFIGKPRSDVDLIINMVENEGECSYEIDEAHGLFDSINSKNANGYQTAMSAEMLLMATKTKYNLSGNHYRKLNDQYVTELGKAEKRLVKELEKADKGEFSTGLVSSLESKVKKIKAILVMIKEGIPNPSMNMAMYSTPEKIDSLGSTDSLESGLMARALIRRISDPRAKLVRNPELSFLPNELLTRLSNIPQVGAHSKAIELSPEANTLIDEIEAHYEQDRFINHPKTGALFVRIIERVTSIASILAVETGIATVDDVRYALVTVLRHIEDSIFLLKKSAAGESNEDLMILIMAVILQKLRPIGTARSKLKQDVLACCKPARDNAKYAKVNNNPSFYDQAIEHMLKKGSIIVIEGTSKLKPK